MEREREENEAAEAKARERAERKSQRETQRRERKVSLEIQGVSKNGRSKLEKELSVQVIFLDVVDLTVVCETRA